MLCRHRPSGIIIKIIPTICTSVVTIRKNHLKLPITAATPIKGNAICFAVVHCYEDRIGRAKPLGSLSNYDDDHNDDFLNGKRIQTHRRPFCTPKPNADLCMRVDLPLDKKLCKMRTGPPGLRAAGQPGLCAVAGRGPRAAGPQACF